jgi:hypothetical protein
MSKTIKAIKHKIAEAMLALIKVTDDGARVIWTHTLPRVIEIKVRKGFCLSFEPERIASTDRMVAIVDRGLRRLIVDGAKGSYQQKDSETGEIVTVKMTEEETQADAIANAENNIAYLYGLRDKSTAIDPVCMEARAILIRWIVRNCTKDTGARYTESSIPAFAKNARTLAQVEQAATQFGVSENGVKNLILKATANIKNLDRDFDDGIAVAE